MPMYDYECHKCGHKFEELVFSSAVPDEEIVCPKCRERKSRRLLSAPSIASGKGASLNPVRGCNPSSGFS